jgi:hypothetical protein
VVFFKGINLVKNGRPPFEPTHQQRIDVEVCVSIGHTHESIAEQMGISVPTLLKYFRKELDSGKDRINADVGRFLSHAASGRALTDAASGATYSDCVRAAMFWAKTRMGFSEKNTQVHQFDLSNLTNEQLEAIANGRITGV